MQRAHSVQRAWGKNVTGKFEERQRGQSGWCKVSGEECGGRWDHSNDSKEPCGAAKANVRTLALILGPLGNHRKIFSRGLTWSDLYLMIWMLCWQKTLGGWGWKQGDQLRSYFNNPGKRWRWLWPSSSSGDSEKGLDSGYIFGGRINRISRKIISELWEKETRMILRYFALTNRRVELSLSGLGETFRGIWNSDLACWVWDI